MNKDKNFYPKMQGKQLSIFARSEYTNISKNVKEAEFIDAFKHLASIVIEAIYSAHENVLEEWQRYSPRSSKTKASILNDRIQAYVLRSISREYPDIVGVEEYDNVYVEIGGFRCVLKKLDSKNLPKFAITPRALERFSQYKREDNNSDIPYVIIGYQCSEDFQQITEVSSWTKIT